MEQLDFKAMVKKFENSVDYYYQYGSKWILSRKVRGNDYDRNCYKNYVKWTKDYVGLYIRDVFGDFSEDVRKKFFSYLNDLTHWSEDRIRD